MASCQASTCSLVHDQLIYPASEKTFAFCFLTSKLYALEHDCLVLLLNADIKKQKVFVSGTPDYLASLTLGTLGISTLHSTAMSHFQ